MNKSVLTAIFAQIKQVHGEVILEKLKIYVDLLIKWNRCYNLTAITDPVSIWQLHILDSLALSAWIPQKAQILDFGTGAGLPGLILALIFPQSKFVLLDSIYKKTVFLRMAVRLLGLENVTVVCQRVENYKPLCLFDKITSRATADLCDIVTLTEALLLPEGEWLLMKGQYPRTEIADLPAHILLKAVTAYQLPELDIARHVVTLSQKIV